MVTKLLRIGLLTLLSLACLGTASWVAISMVSRSDVSSAGILVVLMLVFGAALIQYHLLVHVLVHYSGGDPDKPRGEFTRMLQINNMLQASDPEKEADIHRRNGRDSGRSG
ncbi:MAG: hypothetical protein LBE84_05080 [Planctomycetota bacterium]|nr:hypothetical protein [Planctomycetota bacterium]